MRRRWANSPAECCTHSRCRRRLCVARTLAIVEAPVAIQAFCPPCVATHVPLAANDASPGNAGGILLLMSCQVVPSVVRRSGKTPFTESLCADAVLRCPECEAIVERTRILVYELQSPGRAAIDRFVNSEIGRVATDTDRHADTRPWRSRLLHRGIAAIRLPVPRRPSRYCRRRL